MAAELSAFGERQVVQALGVGPQLGRGAGQRLGHARSQGLLERGQRPVADPGPGEPEVLVVRVLPRLEAKLGAGGGGGAAAHGQQRPAVPAAAGGHPGQRPAARTAGQPEQDGLRLVVEGVAEQDRDGIMLVSGLVEGGVPGLAGRRFRARGRRGHRHGAALRGVEPQGGQEGGDFPGPFGRTGLQPVIDGHSARPQAQPRRHEGRGRGQRQ